MLAGNCACRLQPHRIRSVLLCVTMPGDGGDGHIALEAMHDSRSVRDRRGAQVAGLIVVISVLLAAVTLVCCTGWKAAARWWAAGRRARTVHPIDAATAAAAVVPTA